ncbi:MAG: AAA family ATPase [Scytonematopsis contorta HA4267-MV1]|jgi:energy-coupling factor transporter ATP-binding protein EcfA2|nr:AAA family ATPase [Scytonematopsis contorta HA4267-MV1]
MYISDDEIRQHRGEELSKIKYALSQGHSIVVVGEKGSGKSSTARVLEEDLRAEGNNVALIKERKEKNILVELAGYLDVNLRNPETRKMLLKGDLRVEVESSLTNKARYILLVDDAETIRSYIRSWFGNQRYRNVQLVLFAERPPKSDVFNSIKKRIKLKPFSKQAGFNLYYIALVVPVLILFAVLIKVRNNPPVPVESYSDRNLTATPTYPEINTTEPEYQPNSDNKIKDDLIVRFNIDDFTQIKVKGLANIKKGDILMDKIEKNNRLTKEMESIELQILNLKNKLITKPLVPEKAPSWKAMESQKSALAIANKSVSQAKLILNQARSAQNSLPSKLETQRVELEQEMEKTQAELKLSEDTILEHEKFIESMKNDDTNSSALSNEKANLKTLIEKHERMKSILEEQKAKLGSLENEHNQKSLQAYLNVESAKEGLNLAEANLRNVKYKHEQLKREALADEEEGLEQQKQRQEKYAYDLRNREHQLKVLNSRLLEINKELKKISVVRSPINGHVRSVTSHYTHGDQYAVEVTIIPESE